MTSCLLTNPYKPLQSLHLHTKPYKSSHPSKSLQINRNHEKSLQMCVNPYGVCAYSAHLSQGSCNGLLRWPVCLQILENLYKSFQRPCGFLQIHADPHKSLQISASPETSWQIKHNSLQFLANHNESIPILSDPSK